MKIVIDTNVIASGIFFGGKPRKLIELFLHRKITACASPEIIAEYKDTIDYLRTKYPDHPVDVPLTQIILSCETIEPHTDIQICRDPDDDKFISCALEGRCLYVVSGDNDLLSIGHYKDVEIVTVAQFFDKYNES